MAAKPYDHLVNDNFLTFDGVLDALNPLQQIPVVSTAYREVVDDPISAGSRLLGGLMYGGPIGFIGSLINTLIEDGFGADIGSLALSAFDEAPTKLASANDRYSKAAALL